MNRVAANDMFVRPAADSLRCGEQGMDIPQGHVGPVLLSDIGFLGNLQHARRGEETSGVLRC